jgi:hypothetical protein
MAMVSICVFSSDLRHFAALLEPGTNIEGRDKIVFLAWFLQ